ncbi:MULTISPECIES: hypothetical protein [unclassified Streptomyces]|uniref:hypothetical protein n=1 Tax=unclassified Streptomyces TaxID=2593676 RepID=UPI000DDB1F8A|nr:MULTISPECIES: hypothetical protein [unclassified Streptomyces]QZZ28395.1 hypothetical protein A7X85_20835 [Streptomyces sp. ST1015]
MARTGRRTRIVLATAILAAFLTGAAEESERARICLVPPGNPDAERTVSVPAKSVPALLRTTASYAGPCAEYGSAVPLGGGVLRAYVQRVGARPVAVGVAFPASSLRGLPTAASDGKHCFDKDGNGGIDLHTECSVGHENVLALPPGAGPFTWELVNWNPEGHIPKGVYDTPHFDFHFYIQPLVERNAIRPGPCPALTDCADYARAKKPVPSRYLAPDFVDVDAVEPVMGNHLLDARAPELNGGPFTRTWIYGTYDGEVTFYEAMIAKSWLENLKGARSDDTCTLFRQPRAWRNSGWYPTSYCAEYRENRKEYAVSLTDFVYREGS